MPAHSKPSSRELQALQTQGIFFPINFINKLSLSLKLKNLNGWYVLWWARWVFRTYVGQLGDCIALDTDIVLSQLLFDLLNARRYVFGLWRKSRSMKLIYVYVFYMAGGGKMCNGSKTIKKKSNNKSVNGPEAISFIHPSLTLTFSDTNTTAYSRGQHNSYPHHM